MMKAETLFRILSDGTRLRAVVLLALEGELCVCELCAALGVSQPKMSRHLACMREHGLVQIRRRKTWIYYGLSPELPAWARDVIATVARAVENDEPYVSDRMALDRMEDRPGLAARDLEGTQGIGDALHRPPVRH